MFNSRRDFWSDQGKKGVREGVGNYLKYLKRQWSSKDRRGNKNFKKVGENLGQGVDVLKRGAWNPLMNYYILI